MDKKLVYEWYQVVPGTESLCVDLSEKENTIRACEAAIEAYNLAADMDGMGFIECFRVECLRSILINTHLIRGSLQCRLASLLLFILGLCIQHGTSASPRCSAN